MISSTGSSSGHKLGQIIGDWFEEEVAAYLLTRVARELGLFLDYRYKPRTCRNGKVIWKDLDGNNVDYDFVLELEGSDKKKGIPLAFFETFWRRGARHSKDKARDDSGKLIPMRSTYPTARVLGIISAGDFTKPAQELVQSRGIDLFYIPKAHICAAWEKAGIQIDYPDTAPESEKKMISDKAVKMLTTPRISKIIFNNLVSAFGQSVFDSYMQRIIAGIAAIPVEYNITSIFVGQPFTFTNHEDAEAYLKSTTKEDEIKVSSRLFRYQTIFSDGNIFQRDDLSSKEALAFHYTVGQVAKHFTKHYSNKTV